MTAIEFNYAIYNISKSLKPFAVRLTKNWDDANDLLQDTLVKAFLNREKYADGTNLKGWLYTIMKNIFINNYRRMINSRVVTDDTDNQFYVNSGKSAGNNGAETRLAMEDLEKALAGLTENLRIPFLMSFRGYKYEEIAEQLSIPLGTVTYTVSLSNVLLPFSTIHLSISTGIVVPVKILSMETDTFFIIGVGF